MNTATDSMATASALADRCAAEAPLLQEIWLAMLAQLTRSGFVSHPVSGNGQCSGQALRRDPYDGTDALYGEWQGADGRRLGTVLIRADRTVYAELDVIQPHPSDARWFVEGVTAWGKPDALKTELKLLQSLGT